MKRVLPFLIVVIALLIIVVLYFFGFRITYGPELDNNWTAIDAVGTWVGVLSPLLLAIINASFAKNIEKTKNDIALSNKKIYEQNCNIELPQDSLDVEQQILSYITVCITATTREISDFLKKDVDSTFNKLVNMEINGHLISINNRKNVEHGDVIWKIS